MPLAEAITQLSFLEFLQRCGVSIGPLQPSQLPVAISLLDPAVQATPPYDAFQDVSTQTSDQQVSSLSFDVAVQTSPHGIHISSLDAAVQTTPQSTLSQHVSTQMRSRPASSFYVDLFVQTPIRSVVLHDVAIQLPITEFFIGCTNGPLDRQTLFVSPRHQYKVHVLCCSHRQDSNSSPRLRVPLLVLTCTLHMAHLLQLHLYEPGYVQPFLVSPPQPPACTIHVGTHHARSATTCKRSASTALVGTHNLAITDSRTGSVPFPNPLALVLPLVHFGQSKPERHSGLDTADSDLMHHQFRLSPLPMEPRPGAQTSY